MYCSEKCRDEVYSTVENLDSMISNPFSGVSAARILRETEEAFGGHESFLKFLKQSNWKNFDYTVFDFDLSNPDDPNYRANMIKCILSLKLFNIKFVINAKTLQVTPVVKQAGKGNSLIEIFLLHLVKTCELRAEMTVNDSHEMPATMNSNAFQCYLNHHCEPNVFVIQSDVMCMICVQKSIKAGEQLFRHYL